MVESLICAQRLPAAFFAGNRKALLAKLPPGSCALIWANQQFFHNGDSAFPFMQETNFYYLTGWLFTPAVCLLIKRSAMDTEELLFIHEATALERIWEGQTFTLADAAEQSGCAEVRPLTEFKTILQSRMAAAEQVYVLLTDHLRAPLVARRYNNNVQEFKQLRTDYPLHNYKNLAPFMVQLRMKKHPQELQQLEQAIAVTIAGLKATLPLLKRGDGMGEYALKAELARAFMAAGSSGFAFAPIIAGAERSCILHYVANTEVLRGGSHVLMDVGASWGAYHADLTRVLPVGIGTAGMKPLRFSSRVRTVYEAVLRVHNAALAVLRPGLVFADYHATVRQTMLHELKCLGLVTADDDAGQRAQYAQYFMHGVSHFLGLEVHDVGSMDGVLETGMVLTLEPGIYLHAEGIGIRLENNIFITAEGARNLSAAFPIEPDAVEALFEEA